MLHSFFPLFDYRGILAYREVYQEPFYCTWKTKRLAAHPYREPSVRACTGIAYLCKIRSDMQYGIPSSKTAGYRRNFLIGPRRIESH